MDWVRWFGWTCIAVLASLAFAYITKGLGAATSYNLNGFPGVHPYAGEILSDVSAGIAQCLAVFMYGRKGRPAFWTGIIVTEFVRFIPGAALLAAIAATTTFEIGALHYSPFVWWTVRALIATACLGWLCMKRAPPSVGLIFVSALTSASLLWMVSMQHHGFGIDLILPGRSELLWELLAQ
ncbi:hypothetical protein [Myxococcus vastator]|uniref:hypothetical protein n=1 Tax=Myxococcus vastator TaxID=2709664 RepID=UPI0013D741F1|nr:hypothetical protein [Myxococcus vastator]